MKRLAVIGVVLAAVFSPVTLRTAAAQEPLKVAPEMYKLLHENDRIRVLEVTFKPGSKIPKHSHPDHMVYALTAGKLKIFHDKASRWRPTSRSAISCGSRLNRIGPRTPARPRFACS